MRSRGRIEFRHRKSAGTIGVDQRGRTDAIAAHERARAAPCSVASLSVGNARANNPNCSTRPSVTSTRTVTRSIAAGRRVRFEIEQRERAQHARVAHGRRQLDHPLVQIARDQRQRDAQDDGAPIATLEPIAQRIEQTRQHKRQRLEPLDRPFEIERLFELVGHARPARAAAFLRRAPIAASGGRVVRGGRRAHGRQRRKISERLETPPRQLIDFRLQASGFGPRARSRA